MQESGFTMFLHSAFLAVILYVFLCFIFGRRIAVTKDYMILLGIVILVGIVRLIRAVLRVDSSLSNVTDLPFSSIPPRLF
jgi:hypothetical protein